MEANAVLKLLFIINPGAGANNISWEEVIDNYFVDKPYKVDYHLLEKNCNPEDIKKHIVDFAPDKVIAVGGDGTVTLVAKLIGGTKMCLGILPAGSANGMAKELNIPANPEQALSIIENGKIKCCDAIKINDTNICLHLSDIGLNAQLIKYFDEGKLRGKLGYAKVILKTLWHKQKMHITIKTRQSQIQRIAFMVVLANASKYGTGAVINPTGELDDGAFEIVVIRKLALSELLKMLFKPQPFNPQKIEVFSAASITLTTSRNVHFQIDGEYMGKIKNLSAKILPAYINMILPV